MAGITLEYKRSEEYKQWYTTIKAEQPDMPDLLVDYAIAFHKANPQAYKSKVKSHLREPEKIIPLFTVCDAVKIYDPQDVPAATLVKVVEI